MSSFFDDASLVMIPSGYKDGKVYSVKPTSGAGDLTFTRNSNATRVDANGLVEKVRTNSLLQSNTFDTTWAITRNELTPNAITAPDGTPTAYKTAANANIVANSSRIYQNISVSGVNTISIYAKAGEITEMLLYAIGANDGAYFDISNGSFVSYYLGSTAIDYDIIDLGNGWHRYSLTFNTGITRYEIYLSKSGNYVSDYTLGEGFYIWHSQAEQGLVATDYIETTTTAMSEFAGVTASSVADVPRLDYSGDCPSLLLEPQRTNSCAFSEFIGSYFFYANASATNNATTSPEGVTNAASIIPDATNYIHQIASSNITASGSFTLSAFVKAGELNKVAIRENYATGAYASFDLSTGTKIEDNVSGDAFIESYANGWYRIGVTYTYSGNIRLGINLLSNSYTTGNPSSGATYWSSNGTDKLYVYGLQCELGATYQTSYIPTYGTTVTRLADSCSKTGISSLIGQTEGTIYTEVNFSKLTGTVPREWFIISNATTSATSDWITVSTSGAGTNLLRARIAQSGTIKYDKQYSLPSAGVYKMALAYKSGDCELYVNGSAVGTVATNSAFTLSMDRIITSFTSGTFELGDGLNQALLFTTRLSNADLANLTAL